MIIKGDIIMNKKSFKNISCLFLCIILLLQLTSCHSESVISSNKEYKQLSGPEYSQTLQAYISKMSSSINEVDAVKGTLENTYIEEKDILPDLDDTTIMVQGNGQINIEIFASTEKAESTNQNNNWMIEMAENFNKQNLLIGDKSVSITIRKIVSGDAMSYIYTKKYVPDAYCPSNEMWGEMLSAKGVDITLVEPRLAGNTAGFLMKNSVHSELSEKYGEVDMSVIAQAVTEDEINIAYTNPYTSSTGLSFLVRLLYEYDPANPVSAQAANKFSEFQTHVALTAYDTNQMVQSTQNGKLDTILMSYQNYISNEVQYKDYTYIPVGSRQDNPLYLIGNDSEKLEGLKAFSDFCKSDESQKSATNKGFNALDDYAAPDINISGSDIFVAQSIWKEKKNEANPVVAIFVADTSGSMDGEPIKRLKSSLLNASQYINENNYIGLISYNKDVYVNLPIGQWDLDQMLYFNGSINNLYASGGTATYNAVLSAIDMLEKYDIPNAKPLIFVLSDGESTDGYSLNKISDLAFSSGIPIHTISFNMSPGGSGEQELQLLAQINEASFTSSTNETITNKLKSLLNAEM